MAIYKRGRIYWYKFVYDGQLIRESTKPKNQNVARDMESAHRTSEKIKPLKAWVLYSFRHTFLTRLGESGCDAWTLARIAGHSNIKISQRYVHPSENAVQNAFTRLSGHNPGHTLELKQ